MVLELNLNKFSSLIREQPKLRNKSAMSSLLPVRALWSCWTALKATCHKCGLGLMFLRNGFCVLFCWFFCLFVFLIDCSNSYYSKF